MKKVAAILLALVLVLSFVACAAPAAPAGDVVKIGVYEPASGDNGAGGFQDEFRLAQTLPLPAPQHKLPVRFVAKSTLWFTGLVGHEDSDLPTQEPTQGTEADGAFAGDIHLVNLFNGQRQKFLIIARDDDALTLAVQIGSGLGQVEGA